MLKNAPRVISLVPSWTETLIVAGIHVVGRTRFCVHPGELVKSIPQVGGTKDLDIKKIQELKPDFVIVDKEENTKEMAVRLVEAGIELIVTEVSTINSAANYCRLLSEKLKNSSLAEMGHRYERVVAKIDRTLILSGCLLRGELGSITAKKDYEYVIWKKPFMVVGQNTFIADNLRLAGVRINHHEKYPTLADADVKKAFCLFSSEPYPFLKKYDQLITEGYIGVVVDGEKLSWFGIRNLNFLESCVGHYEGSF